jgi:hypothetical protein
MEQDSGAIEADRRSGAGGNGRRVRQRRKSRKLTNRYSDEHRGANTAITGNPVSIQDSSHADWKCSDGSRQRGDRYAHYRTAADSRPGAGSRRLHLGPATSHRIRTDACFGGRRLPRSGADACRLPGQKPWHRRRVDGERHSLPASAAAVRHSPASVDGPGNNPIFVVIGNFFTRSLDTYEILRQASLAWAPRVQSTVPVSRHGAR